jgi:hypothetical protein
MLRWVISVGKIPAYSFQFRFVFTISILFGMVGIALSSFNAYAVFDPSKCEPLLVSEKSKINSRENETSSRTQASSARLIRDGSGRGKDPRIWEINSTDNLAVLQVVDLGPKDSDIVFVGAHGLTNNGTGMKWLSKPLRQKGARFFQFNWRGNGNSVASSSIPSGKYVEGAYGLYPQLADAEAMIQFARAQGLKINIIGHSMGAMLWLWHIQGWRFVDGKLFLDKEYAKSLEDVVHSVWAIGGPSEFNYSIQKFLRLFFTDDQVLYGVNKIAENIPPLIGPQFTPQGHKHSLLDRIVQLNMLVGKHLAPIKLVSDFLGLKPRETKWVLENDSLSYAFNKDVLADFARLGFNDFRSPWGDDMSRVHSIYVPNVIQIGAEVDILVPAASTQRSVQKFRAAGVKNMKMLMLTGNRGHVNELMGQEAGQILVPRMLQCAKDANGFHSDWGKSWYLEVHKYSTLWIDPITGEPIPSLTE